MLPDLLSMIGTKPNVAQLPPEVAAGRELHYRSDRLFHHDQLFQKLVHELCRTLLESNLRPGPARAASHVGVELLLDGSLTEPSIVYLFRAALGQGGSVRPALPPDRREQWDRLTRRITLDEPASFSDPAEVGRRLQRILERRPRIALGPADLPRTVDALAKHRDEVASIGTQVLARVELAMRDA